MITLAASLSFMIFGSLATGSEVIRRLHDEYTPDKWPKAELTLHQAGDYRMKHPVSYYRPENWPQHTLRITKEGSLKDIFAAGFRPHYWPNTRGDELEIKHSNLTLVTSTGEKLPVFPMEYAKIEIQPSGISTLTLIGQSLTIEEAHREMTKWLGLIGKTEEELAGFLKGVREDPITYRDRHFGSHPEGFGGGWVDSNKIGYGLRFEQAYNPVVPVRIYFTVGWYRVRTKAELRASFSGPPPSPEGYDVTGHFKLHHLWSLQSAPPWMGVL
jgi:hypothetical protein